MAKKAFPKNFWVGKRPSKDFHPAQGNKIVNNTKFRTRHRVTDSSGKTVSISPGQIIQGGLYETGEHYTPDLSGDSEIAYSNKDETKTKTSTEPNHTFLHNISDPNQLFKYASYNVLFTLSALSQNNLEDVSTLLNSKLHDIIIRSAGIGPFANMKEGPPGQDNLSPENRKTVNNNESMKKALERSQVEFQKNNDMYFKNVEMNSIPGLNEERRMTSVTKIQMEIVEPWGITLLERIRAAAVNNGYLDHLDAPYMLTIDFAGWDEKGQPIKDGKNLKRVIPIRLVDMELDVNQGGTVYSVTAIPVCEAAYLNHYNKVRTGGTITPAKKTFGAIAVELEKILNKQVKDETDVGINEIPDTYKITFDGSFNPSTALPDIESLQQLKMLSQADTSELGPAHLSHNAPDAVQGRTEPAGLEYMKITAGQSITYILENIMKAHPTVTDDKFKDWESTVKKKLGEVKGGASAVFEATKTMAEMHFDYFRIRSTVIPTTVYDPKRKTNTKLIEYVISPYKIHAYSLAIPGVSTGDNFKQFVHKTYNYIFTGENVDILDLNIKYKVAYFVSQLKSIDNTKKNKVATTHNPHIEKTARTSARDDAQDQTFILKSEAGMAQSGGTGLIAGGTTAFDQFLDYLTHPKADMVNIRMEILGDPAWLGQSQFIPANPKSTNTGESFDPNIGIFQHTRNAIWNNDLKCYNADVAEPIILLNYRMPTDINDKKGTYELQNTKSVSFSGLYRVVQVEHNFNEGKYTNVLHMVRFNNQGYDISKPYTEYKIYGVNGETFVALKKGNFNAETFDDVVNIQSNIQSKVSYAHPVIPVVKNPNAIPLGKEPPIAIKDLMVTAKQIKDRAQGQTNLELWLDANRGIH